MDSNRRYHNAGNYQRSGTPRGRGRGRGRGQRGRGRGRGGYNVSANTERGRGRGRGRGGYNPNERGRGRPRQRGGGFNNFNNGRGGYNDRGNVRGRGRGRGRGRDRGRGRGRGSGRGFGRPFNSNRSNNSGYKGNVKSERFHQNSHQSLIKEVNKLNMIDSSGPQQIHVVEFTNGWQRIESLSNGKPYYFHPKDTDKFPKKVMQSSQPLECKDAQIQSQYTQEQGSSFAKPPNPKLLSANLPRIPIATNSFVVEGAFTQNTVHSYEVSFEPKIPPKNRLARLRAVKGGTDKQQKKNQKLLNEKFGFWAFDNNNLQSMGAKKHLIIDDLPLSDDHKVIFRWTDSATIGSSDLEHTEEEHLLNVFCKKSMRVAGFKESRRKWFYKNASDPPNMLNNIKPTRINEKCTLLHGFSTRMTLADCNGKFKKGIFKTDLANKQISTKNVNEIIGQMMQQQKLSKEQIKAQLIGKFFIMNYNSISFKIVDIDFSENENSLFELRNGAKISYKEYLRKNYGMDIKFKKECCVIKDDRNNAYLPQFAHLTLKSDEIDDLKDQIQQYTNHSVEEQLKSANGLVQLLNKSQQKESNYQRNDDQKQDQNEKQRKKSLQYGLKIVPQSIRATAIKLNYPRISLMGFGNKVKTTSLHPSEFKWGGRDGTKGFLENIRQIKNWVIVADNQRSIDKIWEIYEMYIGMRGFKRLGDRGPFLQPKQQIINFGDAANYKTVAKGKWQLIFLCLPNGKRGSEIKTRFTKAMQSQISVKNGGCLLQCMKNETMFGRSARDSILGAFEQAMGKMGNILYQITPSLPPQSPYKGKLDKIWTIGIDVSHGGNSKGVKGGGSQNPSVAMLTLQTLPFCGTQRGMRNMTWLNSARKDVIPYLAAVSLAYNALIGELSKLKNEQSRPEIIMIFRDGVPDNALKEVHSKELVGIQRAINLIRNELKEKYKIVWKPKIQFLVVSKDPIDKFGVERNGKIFALNDPVVVCDHQNGISSNKLWDFFMWTYHPNCDVSKLKPKRYVVVRDELKLSTLGGKGGTEGCNNPMGLYEIIYSLSFTYHPSLPFIQGGTSQPAPITFAKRFAEKFAQLITADDKKLTDLKLSKKLTTQPQIITELIDLPITINQ